MAGRNTAAALERAAATVYLRDRRSPREWRSSRRVLAGGADKPTLVFASPHDRILAPFRSARECSETAGPVVTPAAHTRPLSPVRRRSITLHSPTRSTTLIGSRVARFVSAQAPMNRTSLAFQKFEFFVSIVLGFIMHNKITTKNKNMLRKQKRMHT